MKARDKHRCRGSSSARATAMPFDSAPKQCLADASPIEPRPTPDTATTDAAESGIHGERDVAPKRDRLRQGHLRREDVRANEPVRAGVFSRGGLPKQAAPIDHGLLVDGPTD